MSWIDAAGFDRESPFGPQTLPYGVIETGDGPAVAIRVGDHALPLRPIAGSLGDRLAGIAAAGSLDPLLAAGRPLWSELRARLAELATAPTAPRSAVLVPLAKCTTRLPFTVADYVDFYSSRHHAENVGRIFRPDAEPLLPNWTHLPVGYHGRAGTVAVSGTEVVRPCGQTKARDAAEPAFGPSARLDIEAEVGFVCGGPVRSQVPTSDAADVVFGVALVNDWSARDIQAWEYVPLGPFLGKSFLTSISDWITPLDALAAARVATPDPAQPLLGYLVEDQHWGLDLAMEVSLNGSVISRPRFREMSWSFAQQLAHLTVNGATVRPGDLFASGTVSGPERAERGSLLELSWGGTEPIRLDDGTERRFLADGDIVSISAVAPGADGATVGLAEVTGTVLAARAGAEIGAGAGRGAGAGVGAAADGG